MKIELKLKQIYLAVSEHSSQIRYGTESIVLQFIAAILITNYACRELTFS